MSRRLSPIPILLLVFAGCSNEQGERQNLILISIDTLRADHLGCYGYSRETSPRLDAFARGAVLYERAYAPAPWTLPSHVALLTGQNPLEVGIVDRASAIPEDVPMLAESFSQAGYRTGAFVDSTDGGFVGGRRGFARGFDSYQHAPLPGSRFADDMAATVSAGIQWLEQRDPELPFFLFLHTKSVHSTREPGEGPYFKPDPYQRRFLGGEPPEHWRGISDKSGSQQLTELNLSLAAGKQGDARLSREGVKELIALYDAGIYYVDEQFGRLLDALETLELRRDTVIVVVSDHGETFLDHRFLGHVEVYDTALRVPVILHDPSGPRGVRIRTPVQLSDLFALLKDRCGLGTPPAREHSLASPRYDFSYFRPDEDPPYRAYGVRYGEWKLIWHKREVESSYETLLFHTGDDPDELRPVQGQSERRGRLLARLQQWLDRGARGDSHSIDLLDEELEALRALGYF